MNACRAHGMSRDGRRPPRLTAGAVALAIALWWIFGPAPAVLVFDRPAVASGELWRLVTGHLVHSDAGHALWDIAALALIGTVLEERSRRALAAAALLGMVAVDVAIWWGLPDLERYCGLSGVLNTLFVVALGRLWRESRHPAIGLVGLGLGLKLAAETLAGESLVVGTAWPAVPLAHLAGCGAGLLLLAPAAPYGRLKRSRHSVRSPLAVPPPTAQVPVRAAPRGRAVE